MDYRDERDALRGRVENLEQDLASAQEELAQGGGPDRERRIAELEQEMAEGRRMLERMGRELSELRGDAAKGPAPAQEDAKSSGRRRAGRSSFLFFGFVGIVVAAVVAEQLFGSFRSGAPRSPGPAAPRATATVPPAPPAPPPPSPATAPAPSPAPEPVARHATARWSARVKRASGRALAAGAPCVVEAALEGDGGKIHVRRLTVGCGGTALYDSDAKLEGMSMSSSGVNEEAGAAAGTVVYALGYEDKGTRTGARTETSLDSIKGAGAVWSDSAPAFRVELTLPYQSEAASTEPLLDTTRHALRRGATVVSTEGAAPLAKGARCDLRVTPDPKAATCTAHLMCGHRVVYGEGTMGVAGCTLDAGGAVLHVSDTEPTPKGGDPELDVDVAGRTMTLADEVGGARYAVHFALEAEGP